MRTTLAILALLMAHGALAAETASAQTFQGEYRWKQGGDDVLSAEFRPAGDDRWKVDFRFEFNGSRYTWKGTAEGPLTDGSDLSGTVESDGGRRTWEFSARLADGVLTGNHTETTGGRRYATGTFTLKR